MPHRIPLAELVDLVPPTPESARFRYFEPWTDTPFEATRRALTLAQAGWLMEASLLAYMPPEQAVPIFERFRPKPARVEFFENEKHDIECYLLETREAVIVVFRGSEVLRPHLWRSTADALRDFDSVLLDWMGNASMRLVRVHPRSTRRVHRGFLANLDSLWPALGKRLEALRDATPGRRFWFTGHSLGGAMATLAADRFARGVLVTFGAPRVGNARYAANFRASSAFRVVNNSDIVPWVPPAWLGGYKHVGRTWLITAQGKLVHHPSWFRELFDFAHGHLAQVRGLLRGRFDAVALESAYDHSPLLYVRALRAMHEREKAESAPSVAKRSPEGKASTAAKASAAAKEATRRPTR